MHTVAYWEILVIGINFLAACFAYRIGLDAARGIERHWPTVIARSVHRAGVSIYLAIARSADTWVSDRLARHDEPEPETDTLFPVGFDVVPAPVDPLDRLTPRLPNGPGFFASARRERQAA